MAWQERYREALMELSPEELSRRIDAAEKAIHQRIEELRGAAAVSPEEQQAIDDALRGLRVLAKTECRVQRQPESGPAQDEVAS
jgi:hypothetical protein